MAEIGAYAAKTHLLRLLDEVEAGASITITRHGRAVARLTPALVEGYLQAASRILELRSQIEKSSLSMRDLIEEGRQ